MRRPRPTKQLPFVGWIVMFRNQRAHVYAQTGEQAMEFAITNFRIRATQHQYINVALASSDWSRILPPVTYQTPHHQRPQLPENVVVFPNPEEVHDDEQA